MAGLILVVVLVLSIILIVLISNRRVRFRPGLPPQYKVEGVAELCRKEGARPGG